MQAEEGVSVAACQLIQCGTHVWRFGIEEREGIFQAAPLGVDVRRQTLDKGARSPGD